jgi:hypothetical protein
MRYSVVFAKGVESNMSGVQIPKSCKKSQQGTVLYGVRDGRMLVQRGPVVSREGQ